MYSNSSDAERDAAEESTLAALVALYVLVSVIGIIGKSLETLNIQRRNKWYADLRTKHDG